MIVAPPVVLRLMDQFERNREAYLGQGYNETQVRVELIDPLFMALGWDMHNEAGYAEAYKDVVHEDAIKIGGTTKAPDYCFRIGGARKFFLEAKKPSVDIRGEPAPAYQLRRYAWSAKLPLSILTNFEELAVYDCRTRPRPSDKASMSRVLLLRHSDYASRWDELASIFSRDAVLKGSFDKYAEGKGKRGTAEVDTEFLHEIERWRELLARNIAIRNENLSVRQLNDAVQRTIDRIIFLRICEDRGVETYGALQGLLNGENTYLRLLELFLAADDRYNSGLFHFREERERATPVDTLTPALRIDDAILKDILRSLYYPASPYEFSVLPADILGNVYEQFLGKVIHLTGGHRAKVEEKPEVKKAGGVYYTPRSIVDYIVEDTVGRLLLAEREPEDAEAAFRASESAPDVLTSETIGKFKTPRQVAKLRICDPACGSGSFLLGAYRYLLRFHRDWYLADGPEKHRKLLYQGSAGVWSLSTEEKKRILLNNIHGVDIDPQAVEVTKLNLLLCVLENENQGTVRQLALIRQRVLPDLASNIKCGNSLIGSDFYREQQLSLFDDETRYRINAFDWAQEFAGVFQRSNPGFDVIIGNPPYVRIQTLRETQPESLAYFARMYDSAKKGNYDLYIVFVERGGLLLNSAGRLGYILPSKFLTTDYGSLLRKHLAGHGMLDKLVDFGHDQVFDTASTYTCLLFLKKKPSATARYVRVAPKALEKSALEFQVCDSSSLSDGPWIFTDKPRQSLRDKVQAAGTALLQLPATMSRGSSTGADDVFCLSEEGNELITADGEAVDVERGILRTPLYATDFSRFCLRPHSGQKIIFPYRVSPTSYSAIPELELRDAFPNAYEYLKRKRNRLEHRKQYREWYAYSAPRNLQLHDRANILVPLLAQKGNFAHCSDVQDQFCMMASGGFTISFPPGMTPVDPLYLLGVINSKLLFWYLRFLSNKFRGGWITCTKQYFGKLPIRLAAADKEGKRMHDGIVRLVREAIRLRGLEAGRRSDSEAAQRRRQLTMVDDQIDELVYSLYGVTKQEVEMVEEAS